MTGTSVRQLRSRWIVIAIILGLLVLAGSVYRLFFVRLVRVPTGSMMNTILPGDHLVVHRSFGEISRGSIVVFEYPGDTTRYIARVVGLPGETILVRGQSVYINGTELPEEKTIVKFDDLSDSSDRLEEILTEGSGPYKVFYTQTDEPAQELEGLPNTVGTAAPFRLGASEYFLLGDNRDNSEDSRFRGGVTRELMWGTASIIYWSSFRHPNSQEEQIRTERVFSRVR